MKMKKIALISILIGLLGFTTRTVFATHVTGADITYQCLGNNQFKLRINLFRDCSGVSAPSAAQLNIGFSINSNCGSVTPNFTLINPGGTEISQLCPNDFPNSTCNGGWLPGMQIYIYEMTTTLTPCADWTFSYTLCCHNATTNVSGQPTSYFDATMNSVEDDCNTSPLYTAQPIPYFCWNQPVTFNYGVVEPDGDSMTFDFISCRQSQFSPVTYQFPYTANQAIQGITIDNNTGQISFTPNVVGNFIVVVGCNEYDKNTLALLGTTMREIQCVVINCNNQVPIDTTGTIDSLYSELNTATQLSDYELELCQGDSICFDVIISDYDNLDIVTLTSNVSNALPGATFSATPGNPATATICWQAPTNSGFFNSFTIVADDGACPVPGVQTYVYTVKVLTSVNAGPDVTICLGDTAQLSVSGGSLFDWDAISGDTIVNGQNFSCDTCQNPSASPDSTTVYVVTTNLSGNCSDHDTIVVFVTQPGDPTIDALDTLCEYDAPITLSAADTDGVWSSNHPGINNPSDGMFNPQLSSAGSYWIYYTIDHNGCISSDSALIKINPIPPAPTATSTEYCENDIVNDVTATGTGSFTWYDSEGNIICTGADLTGYVATINDTVYVTQTIDGCESPAFPLPISVLPGPTPDFIPNPDFGYAPLNVAFENQSTGQNPLTWDWDIAGLSSSTEENPEYTFDAPGTYDITLIVTDGNGCTDEITKQVIVDGLDTLWVPNVFSPNNDGINDLFRPDMGLFGSEGIENFHAIIYNRWGRKIYEWSNPDEGWDGEKHPDGIYYYVITAVGKFTGNNYELKGYVTMIGSGR